MELNKIEEVKQKGKSHLKKNAFYNYITALKRAVVLCMGL